jgi:hypothetical protein
MSAIFIPEGEKPSRWENTDEFIKFAETYVPSDWYFGFGDEAGLSLETPFGEDSALIHLRTNQKRPLLGSGLLVTIQFPFLGAPDEIAKEVAAFNFWEASGWMDFPQLGCWVPHGDVDGKVGLAHASFIPNVLYHYGLATNFAIWSGSRVRWARKSVGPSSKIGL